MKDLVRIAKEHINAGIKQTLGVNNRPVKDPITKTEVLMMLRDCATEYSWTPDACLLERNEYTPVFVYCNVMQGGNRYSVIENIFRRRGDDGKSANPYVFTQDRFEVWQTRDGIHSIPVALTSRARTSPYAELSEVEREYMCRMRQSIPIAGRVKGRLYYIRSDMMNALDKEKQNGVLFRRRRVNILYPSRVQPNDPGYQFRGALSGSMLTEEDATVVENVWMYQGRHKYWNMFLTEEERALEACPLHDPTLRYHKGRPIFTTPNKRWMNEPYYLFHAWEGTNNK